jgi:hypothetical protein
MHLKQSSIFRKNDYLREIIRSTFTRFHFHKSGPKKDILLLSIGRSGTTWLMEILSREPHLNYINEPTGERFLGRSIAKDLVLDEKNYADNVLFHIPEHLEPSFRQYLTNPKHTTICSSYDIFRKNYHLFTDRRVLKVNNINPVLEYFLDLGMMSMYLLRHPMSNILSCIRGNRTTKISHYLQNDYYRETFLSDSLYEKASEIHQSGNELQQWALAWALSQYPVWLFFQKNRATEKCLLVSYEEILLEPQIMVAKLSKALDLQKPENLLSGMSIPSASTHDSQFTGHTFSGRKKIEQWVSQVSASDLAACFDVIEEFGIDFYHRDSLTVSEQYSLLTNGGAKTSIELEGTIIRPKYG